MKTVYPFVALGLLGLAAWLQSAVFREAPNMEQRPSLGLAPGSYVETPTGYQVATNISEMWPGVWVEGTNGWRVQLYLWETNTPNPWVSIAVGSVRVNSGAGPPCYGPPDGKVAKCELRDAKGNIVPPRPGRSLQGNAPQRVPASAMPRWHGDGGLMNSVGFRTNSAPAVLRQFRIRDVYEIKNGGDYTLSVCPVVYRFETNGVYLSGLDLPCVKAQIFLAPGK